MEFPEMGDWNLLGFTWIAHLGPGGKSKVAFVNWGRHFVYKV